MNPDFALCLAMYSFMDSTMNRKGISSIGHQKISEIRGGGDFLGILAFGWKTQNHSIAPLEMDSGGRRRGRRPHGTRSPDLLY